MIGRREFTRFDQNGDGEIDVDEFGKFLRSFCLYLTSFFQVPGDTIVFKLICICLFAFLGS